MEILKLKLNNFDKDLKKAVELVRQGKVLVCPTDTVGLWYDMRCHE